MRLRGSNFLGREEDLEKRECSKGNGENGDEGKKSEKLSLKGENILWEKV